MSENVKIEDLNHIKVKAEDKIEKVAGVEKEFPKYTTQILNLANWNSGGTRPEVVGQMSELIKECPHESYEKWKEWYLKKHPEAIKKAKKKVKGGLADLKEAMKKIDDDMIENWVEDLVITKTAQGLIVQQIVIEEMAEQNDVPYELATPSEEAEGIDGYLGGEAVSVKPASFLSKKATVRDEISAKLIFYKKTDRYIHIYSDDFL